LLCIRPSGSRPLHLIALLKSLLVRAANARPDDGAKGLAFTYFIVNTREAREF
jgi:hypothetical protein